MEQVTTIGLDITKSVAQVHGVSAGGEVVIRRRLRRFLNTGFATGSRSCRPALDPPRLLQPQDLGTRRLSRSAPQASASLSRRVRLPLQPPPNLPGRLPHPPGNRPRHQIRHLQILIPPEAAV